MAPSGIDWAEMLAENHRWLETVVRSRLGDAHAAEDVMQELAIAVMKQSNRPTEPSKVAPWLYRIALRKVINHRRYQGRQRRLLEGFGKFHEARQSEVDATPGGWLLSHESLQGVRTALQRINMSDRQILLLKYSEGWSYRQLADHLGISVKTVEYRLLRARQALREQLAQEEPASESMVDGV